MRLYLGEQSKANWRKFLAYKLNEDQKNEQPKHSWLQINSKQNENIININVNTSVHGWLCYFMTDMKNYSKYISNQITATPASGRADVQRLGPVALTRVHNANDITPELGKKNKFKKKTQWFQWGQLKSLD